MKSPIKCLSLLLMFGILSCKIQNNKVELELEKCVVQSVNAHIKNGNGKLSFDFYDFILQIEDILIENGLLQNTKRSEYSQLLTSLNNYNDYNKIYKKIMKKVDNSGFGFNLFLVNDAIFNQCPYKVSVDEKEGEGKLVFNQGKILNQIMEQGYDDNNLQKKLLDNIDDESFRKIVYRAPVILLIMINLDRQYNADLKSFEERQKGKKFLNKN